MLRKHKHLWCDLAFRTDHASGSKVDAAWRAAFPEFPDRFMVGTDTFTPERWHYIVQHADWSRPWLADLPPTSPSASPGETAKRVSQCVAQEGVTPRRAGRWRWRCRARSVAARLTPVALR